MEHEFIKFSAIVELKTEDQGGRRTPIENGFRTNLKFDDGCRMAVIEFKDDFLFPGKSIDADVSILIHSEHEAKVFEDMETTEILEGPHKIGCVTLVDILEKPEWENNN